MAAYLDVDGLKAATIAPATYVDAIEAEEPGWTLGRLDVWSRWIDARLRKRYAAPFVDPVPLAVLEWLAAILTWECYLKRGVNALDAQTTEIRDAANTARAEVLEAANGNAGLWDLPLREGLAASGISKGGPRGTAEASPYTWTDAQIEAIDANGE